jgi:hypothetical protein
MVKKRARSETYTLSAAHVRPGKRLCDLDTLLSLQEPQEKGFPLTQENLWLLES